MGLFKKYRQKIRMVKSLRKYYRRGNRLTLVGGGRQQNCKSQILYGAENQIMRHGK